MVNLLLLTTDYGLINPENNKSEVGFTIGSLISGLGPYDRNLKKFSKTANFEFFRIVLDFVSTTCAYLLLKFVVQV